MKQPPTKTFSYFLCYTLFMEMTFKKYFLNFYVWLNYIAICTNIFIVLLIIVLSLSFYVLGGDRGYDSEFLHKFFFYVYSAISLALINALITIFSTLAIRKIRRNELLNIFQKICVALFPLINIPLYAFICFHMFILQDW